MLRSSIILLGVFLLLGAGVGMVTATASESKTENNKKLFGASSIQLWWCHHYGPSIGWWWRRPHPKKLAHIAPSLSPLHDAAPSLIDHVVSAPHMAPSLAPGPTTSCMKMDDCVSDLIRSIFRHKISLFSQCYKVVSTISDDCFYQGFRLSKRVPFFLSKVRNYCSHYQRWSMIAS